MGAATGPLFTATTNPEDGKQQTVGVCTRGMMFTDPSVTPRVVEWIELLSLLGAGRVFLYYYDLPRELAAALEIYREEGKVDLTRRANFVPKKKPL